MLLIVVVFCIVFFALFDIAEVNFRFIDIQPGLGSVLNIFHNQIFTESKQTLIR